MKSYKPEALILAMKNHLFLFRVCFILVSAAVAVYAKGAKD
jgi:hypothetical protein